MIHISIQEYIDVFPDFSNLPLTVYNSVKRYHANHHINTLNHEVNVHQRDSHYQINSVDVTQPFLPNEIGDTNNHKPNTQ